MTTTGGVSDARAALRAEIEGAAPRAVPADRVIALLREIDEPDVAELAALAYEALTGVAPRDEPAPPAELVPGFPPFASEVLMRAMSGPEDRRPTSQAMVVVLETVPATAWPVPVVAEPAAVVAEPAPAVAEPAPAVAAPAPEEQPADEAEGVVPETASDPDEDFRSIVGARHTVPRFEPLEGAGELPMPTVRRRRRRRSGHGSRRPAQVAHQPRSEPEPPPPAMSEPDAGADLHGEAAEQSEPTRESRRRARQEQKREAREERRQERDREREQNQARRSDRELDARRGPAGEARDQTLVLVGVLVVLIVLGVLYAMNRDDAATSGVPPAGGVGHSLVGPPTG